MNKEVNDALHTLLNLSLKDKSFSTQKQQFKIVYDYITNLQEENVRFREIICFNEDYKSRIDKAIEYIKSNEWAKDYENSNCRTHLLNILNGGDKE